MSDGNCPDGVPLNGVPFAGPAVSDGGATCSGIAAGPALPGTPGATAGTGAAVAGWGVPSVAARLRVLTDLLADGAAAMGLPAAPRRLRSPHILGLRAPGGLPEGLIGRLRADGVFASDRLGGLRLSPHVWANEADVARCLAALQAALP